MKEWMNERVNEWMNQKYKWIKNGRMEEWINKWMGEWMNELINKVKVSEWVSMDKSGWIRVNG